MYYGRKKGIIILIILIVLIILLGVGGFAVVFFTTDMFKPNDAMFFKYLGQSIEEMQFTDNLQISDIESLQKQMPYTIDGSVGVTVDGTTMNSSLNALNNTKIEYNGKVDPINEKVYGKAELKSNNESIFAIEYANSNNIFALKSDEIVTAFIGIENKELSSMTRKMGYPVEGAPDEIGNQNLGDVLKLTEKEKKHILEMLTQVVQENVPSSAFTRENNIATVRDGITYDTTGYRLNLTYEQLRKLEIAILTAIKQDNVTLNILSTKASDLGLGDEYTDVTKLSGKINELIGKIQSNTKIGDDISIIVYVANGEVITTEVIQKNVAKYTITCKKSDTGVKRNLLIENFDAESQFGTLKIDLTENNTTTLSYINLTVTVDDDKTFSFSINNEGSAAQEYLNSTIDASFSDSTGNSISFNATQKLQFVEELTDIIELSRSNCGVLNDYTDEQIQTLMASIIARATEVFNEKINKLGLIFQNNETVTPVLNDVLKEQEILAFNSRFESYKGIISGVSLSVLNNVLKKNNEDSKNKSVVLIVNGINTAGDNKAIENGKNYKVEMKYNEEGYIYEITAVDSTETTTTTGNTTNTNSI